MSRWIVRWLVLVSLGSCHSRGRDGGRGPSDSDEDGILDEVDTDDDGDGLLDTEDVDDDGDGVPEEPVPPELLEAAEQAAARYCEYAVACCGSHLQSWSRAGDMIPCQDRQVEALLPEFLQASVSAGAVVDAEEEASGQADFLRCPTDFGVQKGQAVRVETADELLLPFFHGVRLLGEPCITRWDCERRARCEGLVEGSGAPGVCATRPWQDGPCAEREPYCPVGTTCTVLDAGTICERAHEEDQPCRAFELGGRRTDNCSAEQWCDDTLDAPVCRPVLHEGDPCEEDRQCVTFECPAGDQECPPLVTDWFDNARAFMPDWCEQMFPTAEPINL